MLYEAQLMYQIDSFLGDGLFLLATVISFIGNLDNYETLILLLFCVCLERSQANKILLQPGIL